MTADAVIFDFYGTLARATAWDGPQEVLARHGVTIEPDTARALYSDDVDGTEHHVHSASRDHYVAWQRERTLRFLHRCAVPPALFDVVLDDIRTANASRMLEAYEEAPRVLAELREAGVAVGICSNWDWDLAEAVDDAGLSGAVDLVISSAWVGARKPHPLIYDHTIREMGIDPARTVFVGDTWGPDVEGPLAAGMSPVYLRRAGHWPDHTCPHPDPGAADGVPVLADLTGVPGLTSGRRPARPDPQDASRAPR